jgi:hypothetical protein
MAYCGVPAILRASRMAVHGTERVTDANTDRKEQESVRVSDLLFNRVHPAVCGGFVDCRRSTRALVAADERASVAARNDAAAKVCTAMKSSRCAVAPKSAPVPATAAVKEAARAAAIDKFDANDGWQDWPADERASEPLPF